MLNSTVGRQVLTLDGNPLAALPNYRAGVLDLLPRLQSLDGRGVTEEERERAPVLVQAEAASLAVMVSNACLVHKLVRWPAVAAEGAWRRGHRPLCTGLGSKIGFGGDCGKLQIGASAAFAGINTPP